MRISDACTLKELQLLLSMSYFSNFNGSFILISLKKERKKEIISNFLFNPKLGVSVQEKKGPIEPLKVARMRDPQHQQRLTF